MQMLHGTQLIVTETLFQMVMKSMQEPTLKTQILMAMAIVTELILIRLTLVHILLIKIPMKQQKLGMLQIVMEIQFQMDRK